MQNLTDYGLSKINDIAQRYGLSQDAVLTMLTAVSNGGGTMAQFYHPELGGGGQWMQGGMTMVGDMFNNGLKNTVNNLCGELSTLLYNESQAIFQPVSRQQQGSSGFGNMGGNWWPSDLGSPSTSGSQNNIRYAWFPQTSRLAIEQNGQLTIYDTLNHQIGGVSQQQSGGYSLTFTSQFGNVQLENLPVVSGQGQGQNQTQPAPAPAPVAQQIQDQWQPEPVINQPQVQAPPDFTPPPGPMNAASNDDIFSQIERLADLRDRGILNEDEFSAKKADLLSRL